MNLVISRLSTIPKVSDILFVHTRKNVTHLIVSFFMEFFTILFYNIDVMYMKKRVLISYLSYSKLSLNTAYNLYDLLDKNKYDIHLLDISNYFNNKINIFNNYSIKECAEYGINKVTLSRELSKTELEDILKYNLDIDTELIVYGTLPIMSCNYCFLGKSNMCYPECKRLCSDDNSYYLKDRLGFKFRIVSDNIQSITSIFNSKILSISPKTFNVSSVRIDILDENVTTINKIIETVKSGKSFEGKEYTSGRLEEEK